jgi:large subunit ribosomal protein L29
MKTEEMRALSVDAVLAQVNDAKEELMRLRFQQATGELTDYSRLRITRRNIARLFTILREQQAVSGGTGGQRRVKNTRTPENRMEGEK